MFSGNHVIINLLTEKKGKKIYVSEALIFSKHTVTVNLNKFLQTPSSDNVVGGKFTCSNSIILVEDLTRWKRGFELFLIDHYAGDIRNKNIAIA